MTEQIKHRGKAVDIGGREYVIPPLNFRQLQEFEDRLPKMGNFDPQMGLAGLNSEQRNIILDLILSALQRNYPETTKDQLLDMLDLSNLQPVMMALVNQSGLKPAQPGEPTAESQSIGSASTAS